MCLKNEGTKMRAYITYTYLHRSQHARERANEIMMEK